MLVGAVTAAMLLAGSACASDDGAIDDGSTTTARSGPVGSAAVSTSAPSTEPGVGVTEDEILVGVVYTDLEAISDIVDIDHGDYYTAFQALADDINARGGINGRRIRLVDGPVSPVGTESATNVCTIMTEDRQVFAVIGNVQADATPCYVTDHDTALVGGQQTAERLGDARAPWFSYDAGLDYTAIKTIEGASDDGAFEGKRVAIVSLPQHERLLADSLEPALGAAGVEVVSRAVVDAPGDDQTAARMQAQTFAERFQADGADMVITVGDAFLSFARGLEFTSYRPQLVATDRNIVEAYLAAGPDYDVLPGLIAGGGPSIQDAWTDPVMQSCVDRIKAIDPSRSINDPATATPDTPNTWVSVSVACQAMSLFEAIVSAAGETLNNDTFLAAGLSLGAIDIPGKLGTSTFTPTSPSGDPPVFLGRWDVDADEMVVSTTPVG
jgi:ABC-type branched-subunit amino acid transport system substrate-binding protein